MNPPGPRIELTLRDGTRAYARPLGWGDRDWVADAYRRISAESRYQRFWTRGGAELGEATLRRLLDADQVDHAVWAVIDPRLESAPGLGGASYWRTAGDPEEAEFSVTVADEHQRRGVGTLLLALLWIWAWRHGVRRFVAYTLPQNRRANRWMMDTGARGSWDGHQCVFRWQLDDFESLPPTPAAADLAARLAELAAVLLDGGPPPSGQARQPDGAGSREPPQQEAQTSGG
jgi:RimJ/RimL family protein N-acetyltransferase